MARFEKIKAFVNYVKEYWRKKKEEREVTYMQSRGNSILKNSNFMDHPYMQKPMTQMGLDKGIKMGVSQNQTIASKMDNKDI
jgi:hypothetical protein